MELGLKRRKFGGHDAWKKQKWLGKWNTYIRNCESIEDKASNEISKGISEESGEPSNEECGE